MGCQSVDCQATRPPTTEPAWTSTSKHRFLHGGSERQRPYADRVEVLSGDEIWAAAPGGWWVLCGYVDAYRVKGYKVHAAAPFQPLDTDDEIAWVDLDLDLDFEVIGDEVALEDETQFHEHAQTMGYPDEVVRGAWSGISWIAAPLRHR
jgi:hypothetical protein